MKTIYFFPLLIFLSFSLTGCTLIDELLDETRQSSSSLETAVTSQSLSMDSEASSSFSTEKQTTSTTIDISSSSDSLDQQSVSTEESTSHFSYCEQLQIGLPRRWNRTVTKDLLHQLQEGMSCDQVLEIMGGLPSWRLAILGVESNAWINQEGEAIIVTLSNRTVTGVTWHDQFSETEIE
ncbi:hypothetical protein [Enterococcus casseliflavus]|uniref:hypothetical protein n=1 Tax=Enterococcus TaxID=1350 RepID=UPI0009BFCAE7|nr:hypothetical protein [Enterococcus casseliflavus]MCD5201357.1 hypothetical protein [Enterococcus casseliflavus]MCX4168422.1 hypothetical protein [Enterococcus casseliflavus]MDT2954605.1 hypothetical protein [Enterococcus casseliflavus]MDT2957875.1 hypothetical protein [Enterococcus casseliflavus]MDT2989735.1 hypothetical protein [Enterococcus casseliflavus]